MPIFDLTNMYGALGSVLRIISCVCGIVAMVLLPMFIIHATRHFKESERRHQETVTALQDIAKAIRECNEE